MLLRESHGYLGNLFSEKMSVKTVWMLTILSVSFGKCSVVVDTGVTPPQFKAPPTWPDRSYYDEDGPPIFMSCKLKMTEGVTIVWHRDGKLLQHGNSITISDKNQTVTLEIPKQNQTGTYKCQAFNLAGSINHTGYIYIAARKQETRPRIIATDPTGQVRHAAVGDNVTISCVFDVGGTDIALMDLANNWLRNDTALQDNNHSTYGINTTRDRNQVFSLTISNFEAIDYGEYVCYGENRLGNDSKAIFLTPPEPLAVNRQWVAVIGGSVGGVFIMGTVVMVTLFMRRRREWNKYEELEWLEPDISNFQVPGHKLEFDVFISYSSNDLKWVKNILFDTLVANGYSVCTDFKDFTPGMAVSENIIDAIYKSRHTVVLLSKNFLKSMWGQFELQQALNRAVIQRNDLLLVIKLDKSKVPIQLMGKTFLDWSDKKVQPHFWQRLYEALGEPADFENQQPAEFEHQKPADCENQQPADFDHQKPADFENQDTEEQVKYDEKDETDDELGDSGIAEEYPAELLPMRTNKRGVDKGTIEQDDAHRDIAEVNVEDFYGFKKDSGFVEPVRAYKDSGDLDDEQADEEYVDSLGHAVQTHIRLDTDCIIDLYCQVQQ